MKREHLRGWTWMDWALACVLILYIAIVVVLEIRNPGVTMGRGWKK